MLSKEYYRTIQQSNDYRGLDDVNFRDTYSTKFNVSNHTVMGEIMKEPTLANYLILTLENYNMATGRCITSMTVMPEQYEELRKDKKFMKGKDYLIFKGDGFLTVIRPYSPWSDYGEPKIGEERQ